MTPVARTYSIHKEHNAEHNKCLSSCVNNNKRRTCVCPTTNKNNGMINTTSTTASYTSNIHHYKSTKREILNCNANIFINQKQIKSELIIKHVSCVI